MPYNIRITEVLKTFESGHWRAEFNRRENGQKFLDVQYGVMENGLRDLSDNEVSELFTLFEEMREFDKKPWEDAIKEAIGEPKPEEAIAPPEGKKSDEGKPKLRTRRAKG